MALLQERKNDILKTFAHHDTDTGSVEVQVALLSANIQNMSTHLATHKKDFASTHGLTKMISRRRRLLKYVQKNDSPRYKNLIERLGLRH